MHRFRRSGWLLAAAALLSACAAPAPRPEPAAEPAPTAADWPRPDSYCASPDVLLDAHFETGNLGQCTVEADGSFTLSLIPEDAPPINPSPWYAFRVSGAPGTTVRVRLEATRGHIRYWPKTSVDGRNWTPLPPAQTDRDGDKSPWMTFAFELDGAYRWVAGQEIMDTWDYQHRIRKLDAVDGVTAHLLGHSVEGRPLYIAETDDRPEFVLFVGRQHPPEVTGAIAMRAFMDTVFADTELALRFRDRFKLGVVPLMNPDGVARGHWRHSVGDVDLNRDWGPFEQPETQAVIGWVEAQEAAGRELRLMIDFHSTWEDLFYTPPKQDDPPDLVTRWLDAARARLPDFPFRHVPSTNLEQANSKNYFYRSRGIPAVTYEVGDETDRAQIRAAAVVFAEELMRIMLERPEP
ncbi:MAG: M14-type cytosolic carboxypeptidase [Xanthomonadales bacterium]